MPSLKPSSLVLVLAFLLSPALAEAQGSPRSVSECERLKNDLAYNQCLSMFGPAAKNVAGGEGAASATGTAVALPPALAAIPTLAEPVQEVRRGRRSRRGSYGRGGRQSASFTTGGGEARSYRRHRRRH